MGHIGFVMVIMGLMLDLNLRHICILIGRKNKQLNHIFTKLYLPVYTERQKGLNRKGGVLLEADWYIDYSDVVDL